MPMPPPHSAYLVPKNWLWLRVPISYVMLIRIVRYINNYRAWPVTILYADSGVSVAYTAQNLVLSVPTIPWFLLVRYLVVYAALGSC